MTRINCGIPVQNLTGKHLLAEHREIKRIPNTIKKGRFNMNNQPEQFTLGTGHVKFFYDKLKYLHLRYISIYNECVRRGYNVQYFGDCWTDLPVELYNNYRPTIGDSLLLQERIKIRLNNKI